MKTGLASWQRACCSFRLPGGSSEPSRGCAWKLWLTAGSEEERHDGRQWLDVKGRGRDCTIS